MSKGTHQPESRVSLSMADAKTCRPSPHLRAAHACWTTSCFKRECKHNHSTARGSAACSAWGSGKRRRLDVQDPRRRKIRPPDEHDTQPVADQHQVCVYGHEMLCVPHDFPAFFETPMHASNDGSLVSDGGSCVTICPLQPHSNSLRSKP